MTHGAEDNAAASQVPYEGCADVDYDNTGFYKDQMSIGTVVRQRKITHDGSRALLLTSRHQALAERFLLSQL